MIGQKLVQKSADAAVKTPEVAPAEFGNLAWGSGSCQGKLGGEVVSVELGLRRIQAWLVKNVGSHNGRASKDGKGNYSSMSLCSTACVKPKQPTPPPTPKGDAWGCSTGNYTRGQAGLLDAARWDLPA